MKNWLWVACAMLAVVSAGPASAGNSSPSNSPSSGPGGNAQTPAAPSSPSGGPPSGVTSGTLPIESTVLAYKALFADATAIAAALGSKTSDGVVIIGTSTDVAAIVQLRVVLAQGKVLRARLDSLRGGLGGIPIPHYSKPPVKQPPHVGAPFVAGPADVAALLQGIAGITAVNETLAAGSAVLNDTTLINVIAHQLAGKTVYVPSLYPPNLLSTDLSTSNLGAMIDGLEVSRDAALKQATAYSQAVQDAQTILSAPPHAYSDADLGAAGALAEQATSINSLVTLVGTASSAVDAFELSLFSGQGVAPGTSGNPSGSQNATGGGPPAALPAAVPAPPLGAQSTPNPGAPSSPTPSGPPGAILQQILYADLLLRALPTGTANADRVWFLSIHALESGGGQWTKSNLFLGSRIYFSGGAVASFALLDGGGAVQCSGVAYGYQGLIREKKMQEEISGTGSAVAKVSATCSPPPTNTPARQ